jgi:hypothetical protein
VDISFTGFSFPISTVLLLRPTHRIDFKVLTPLLGFGYERLTFQGGVTTLPQIILSLNLALLKYLYCFNADIYAVFERYIFPVRVNPLPDIFYFKHGYIYSIVLLKIDFKVLIFFKFYGFFTSNQKSFFFDYCIINFDMGLIITT